MTCCWAGRWCWSPWPWSRGAASACWSRSWGRGRWRSGSRWLPGGWPGPTGPTASRRWPRRVRRRSMWRCGWRWPPRWSSWPRRIWPGRCAMWGGRWSGSGRWPPSRWRPPFPLGWSRPSPSGSGRRPSCIWCSAPRRAVSPWPRSPTPWPTWGSRPAGCARRRWSPAGWPSPPPRPPTGACCWSRCMAATPGTASCWPPPGPRCGTGATPRIWRWAAAPRSSTRPSSRCWPSGPRWRCSRWWPPGWPRSRTRCW